MKNLTLTHDRWDEEEEEVAEVEEEDGKAGDVEEENDTPKYTVDEETKEEDVEKYLEDEDFFDAKEEADSIVEKKAGHLEDHINEVE